MFFSRFTTEEPLTLFWSNDDVAPNLTQLYDWRNINVTGVRPLRKCADAQIAKVLPGGSVIQLGESLGNLVEVVGCKYKPFHPKKLFAIRGLCRAQKFLEWECRRLPSSKETLQRIVMLAGLPYLYGGSAPFGSLAQAEKLIELGLFKKEDLNNPELRQLMMSSGVDCSGLFNYGTNYHFFGDTRHVYDFFKRGLVVLPEEVKASPKKIANHLRPLDIIIYRGHMMVVIDTGFVVQAVGVDDNAISFGRATGWDGDPNQKYNKVVIDKSIEILHALINIQKRTLSNEWVMDDQHFMIIRWLK